MAFAEVTAYPNEKWNIFHFGKNKKAIGTL
jgi:hypothetical protein